MEVFPNDVLFLVFSHLPCESLGALQQVNKHWSGLLADSKVRTAPNLTLVVEKFILGPVFRRRDWGGGQLAKGSTNTTKYHKKC